ncbi:MAG: hypothetical protein JWM38_2674 [Sphingomonas bacterium]|jgi:uncharacterized protein YdbL (DUF1318 family)|nr:hypothetical protein [Sphingomonas bacterium]MDB5719247.1 hypothetical protein [Sphingomonas bacterium]
MNRRAKIMIGLALGIATLGAGVAIAQAGEDAVVASARAAGIVGEQADGYLGFAKTPPADVKAAVDATNIKRRAIYTEIAGKPGSVATVQEVAAARGCEQLARRVAPGQPYRLTPSGAWQVRGDGPIALPAVCG